MGALGIQGESSASDAKATALRRIASAASIFFRRVPSGGLISGKTRLAPSLISCTALIASQLKRAPRAVSSGLHSLSDRPIRGFGA